MINWFNLIKSRLLRYISITFLFLILIPPIAYVILSIFKISLPKSDELFGLYMYTIGYDAGSSHGRIPQVVLCILAVIGIFAISILTAYITVVSVYTMKGTKNVKVSKDIIINRNNDNEDFIKIVVENKGSEIYDIKFELMWHEKALYKDAFIIRKLSKSEEYAALPKKTAVTAEFKIDDEISEQLKHTDNNNIYIVSYFVYSDYFLGQQYTIKTEHKLNVTKAESLPEPDSMKQNQNDGQFIKSFNLLDAIPINSEAIDLYKNEDASLRAEVHFNKDHPEFTMALLLFEKPYKNWVNYYDLRAAFRFRSKGEGLAQIRLEIKNSSKKPVIDTIVDITDEFKDHSYPISNCLDRESLKDINEICFTVYRGYLKNKKKLTGEFTIINCELVMPDQQKEALDEAAVTSAEEGPIS